MFENVNFANQMYTKISDLKLNNKLKYHEHNLDRIENTDLDYLFYDENKQVPKKKKKKKIIVDKKQNNPIKLYFMLFVVFCCLNSYFMINLINSYKIQYKLSLAIRASFFLILYYLIDKISNK